MKRIYQSTSIRLINSFQKRFINTPSEPIIDYQSIINHKSKSNQNLINRKSNLRSDSINDLAYLYHESKALQSKLMDAKQRQNHLSEKIKSILNPTSKSKPKPKPKLKPKEQEEEEEDQEVKVGNGSGSTSHLIHVESISVYHQEASLLKSSISTLTKDLKLLNQRLLTLGISIPNQTHPDVPIGSYSKSKVIKTFEGSNWNQIQYDYQSFEPIEKDKHRDHLKIMNQLEWISLKSGSNSTGSNFVFLFGSGGCLELALVQYALSMIIGKGWKLVLGPDLVKTQVLKLCGFEPRDLGETHQTYYVSNQLSSFQSTKTSESTEEEEEERRVPELCLSATSEIPMISSFHSTTLPNPTHPDFPHQPIRWVSVGNAFRSEAGARGLESKGLYRLHQFKKIELVCLMENDLEKSEGMLWEMIGLQCRIIEGLGLPYRVLEMSSEELGNSAFHKYDIETWMPSKGKWGEITSASNCTDYQSRRLNIKYKSSSTSSGLMEKKKETEFLHTLNATGLAIPRIMMSLIENGYLREEEGNGNGKIRIRLPSVLKAFWLGVDDEIIWV